MKMSDMKNNFFFFAAKRFIHASRRILQREPSQNWTREKDVNIFFPTYSIFFKFDFGVFDLFRAFRQATVALVVL